MPPLPVSGSCNTPSVDAVPMNEMRHPLGRQRVGDVAGVVVGADEHRALALVLEELAEGVVGLVLNPPRASGLPPGTASEVPHAARSFHSARVRTYEAP